MTEYIRNPILNNPPIPMDIVLGPAWWYKHEGITFDEDFFFHPAKRVEAERKMEQVLHKRWGRFGLGSDYDKDLPQVGAVHLAAGFLLSEMLGCRVEYKADTPPQVIPAERTDFHLDPEDAFSSDAFHRFVRLTDSLKEKYGYLVGDVNWSGVLNLALDWRGSNLFMDFFDKGDEIREFFQKISQVVERFVVGIENSPDSEAMNVNVAGPSSSLSKVPIKLSLIP